MTEMAMALDMDAQVLSAEADTVVSMEKSHPDLLQIMVVEGLALDEPILLQPGERLALEGLSHTTCEHLAACLSGDLLPLAGRIHGTTYLEIIPGGPTAGPIQTDEMLEYDRSMNLADLSDYFVHEVHPIVKNMQTITHWMTDTEADFLGTFREMHKVAKEMQDTQQRMNVLLDDMLITSASMRKASEDVSIMASNVDRTIGYEIPRLRKSTEFTLEEANLTLRHYRRLSNKADKTVDAVQPVVEEASEITSGLKQSWPLKGVLGTPRTQTAPIWHGDLPLPASPRSKPSPKARPKP